jgi:hypothetical protein
LATLITISRSNVSTPTCVIFGATTIPFEGKTSPLFHLFIYDTFDYATGLFHFRGKDRGRFGHPTVIPATASVENQWNHDENLPKLGGFLPRRIFAIIHLLGPACGWHAAFRCFSSREE